MGGEGPYVRFNENHRPAYRTMPHPLDDEQLDETYTRAHDFLLQRIRALVELGWEEHNSDGRSYPRLSCSTDLVVRQTHCLRV